MKPKLRTDAVEISEELGQALASFRTAAVAWSAAAAPQVMLPRERRTPPQRIRPVWVLAAAALLLTILIPFSMRRGQSGKPGVASAVQAQISRDNQLLARIQYDVGETTPTPLQPLQVNR